MLPILGNLAVNASEIIGYADDATTAARGRGLETVAAALFFLFSSCWGHRRICP